MRPRLAVQVARDTQADVMLLDVRPGESDGPEVCRRVLEVAPRTAVVTLTNYLQDGLVFRSLVAGAKGYVIKDVELGELKKMIRSVYRGASVLDPKVTSQAVSTVSGMAGSSTKGATAAMQAAALSDTDLTIIRSIAEGMTDKQIGQRVHLSPHTIQDRLEKLFALLGVRSRSEVVAEALRRGLL